MKALYFVRTVLVSPEALLILCGIYMALYEQGRLDLAASALSFNDEVLKYIMLAPIGLVVWIFNELRQLVFENRDTTRVLVQWPDYWRLKLHIFATALFAFCFAALSLLPWVTQGGIGKGLGLLLFAVSLLGQLLVVASVYFARFRLQELVSLLGPDQKA